MLSSIPVVLDVDNDCVQIVIIVWEINVQRGLSTIYFRSVKLELGL